MKRFILILAIALSLGLVSSAEGMTANRAAHNIVRNDPQFCEGIVHQLQIHSKARVEGEFIRAYVEAAQGHPGAPSAWRVWHSVLVICQY